MLYLIGLGLHDEMDLTLKAIETAKNCECYIELYTSVWKGSLKNLEEMTKNNVQVLKRKDLEENLESFIENAKKNNIALFVPGDPLAATTHMDIAYEAKRKKIPVKIIHNSSIFSAIGEVGLQLYKYGKTATIPLSGKLDNVKNALQVNKKLGLHTLLLLDLDMENNIVMKVSEALNMLLDKKIIKETDQIIAFSNAGGDSKVYYDSTKGLKAKYIDNPAVLIIPGKLHFREKDFLEMI
ncbi:diphthine synthase [Candidatus Micrarchaeota archaeon RBG_16_36_9]|nr:MAG: diphthine synthase [Candidatus Micrarchaeota archaeon RBG_16_36_9]